MGYFRFFHRPDFFPPSTIPYKLKKYFFTKNPLNYYSLKFTKLHGDSVKKRVLGQKNVQGGACLGLKVQNNEYIKTNFFSPISSSK